MGCQGRAVAILQPSLVDMLSRIRGTPCALAPSRSRGNKPSCLLAQQGSGKLFTVYKPNIGRQSQLESLDSLSRRISTSPRGPLCTLNGPVSSSPRLPWHRWGIVALGPSRRSFPPTSWGGRRGSCRGSIRCVRR